MQYDILYGKQYVYGGENPFEATKMQLGYLSCNTGTAGVHRKWKLLCLWNQFYAASRLEINKELQETQYISPTQLLVQNVELADGDQVSVATQSNSSTKKVLSRTDYLTYNEDNGELMSQENYQAKKSAKAMIERLKEQHAEQTEDDGRRSGRNANTRGNNTGTVSDTGTCVHTGILRKRRWKSQKLRHNLLDYYHHYYIMESTGKPDKYIR